MLKALFERKDESIQRELKEIASLMLKRIDRKIDELKGIEKRIDEKLELLRTYIEKAEEIQARQIKKEEVISLHKRGLSVEDIASSLNMPSGEIDLILRLCKDYPQGKIFLSKSRQS